MTLNEYRQMTPREQTVWVWNERNRRIRAVLDKRDCIHPSLEAAHPKQKDQKPK